MSDRPFHANRAPSTALVTGAAGSIGRETVVALARLGWFVAATDRAGTSRMLLDQAVASARVSDLVANFDLDVTDQVACSGVVGEIAAWAEAPLDLLVNNAGVRSAGLFTHTPSDAHRAMFAVNYFGVCNVTRAVLPLMRAQGHGHVVVVSSVGALGGLPGLAGYCASKSAVEGWAESVAMEIRPFGVRFTLVEPASVRSDIWRSGSFHVADDAPDASLGSRLHELDAAAERSAGDPRSVARAIVRSAGVGPRWTPTRVPVGVTAIARHVARGVVAPRAQRMVLRRALHLAAPVLPPPRSRGDAVLVTGASSGLGHDLLLALHDQGWRVIASVRGDAKRDALRADLDGRDIDIVTMEQNDEASVRLALGEVASLAGGSLAAVVANAGLKVTGPFEELAPDALQSMIDVNVFGTWFVVRGAIDLLRAHHGGRIVVVGSSSGFTGMPGWSGYAAAKFALETWAEALAYELEAQAISVTMVEPGTFRSGIYREGSTTEVREGPYAHLATVIAQREQDALRKAGGPEPVVQRIVDVLSSARPPARAPVGAGARARHLARGVIPGSIVQRLLTVR